MPVARQALRRLLGDQVVWFTPLEGGGYELRAETRLGPLFDGSEVSGAGGGLREARAARFLARCTKMRAHFVRRGLCDQSRTELPRLA